MAMPERDDPPAPRLRPPLKLPPARFTLRRTRRHDKSADKYEIGREGVARRICRGFTKLLHDLHVLHG